MKTKLLQLSNGQTVYADTPDLDQRLLASGVQVVGTRESYRKRVHWCKMTAMEVLEEAVLPGRWIPIVPCYGAMVIVDDKRKKYGLVRFAKDPQQMLNYWRTASTELVALQPKAPYIGPRGAFNSNADKWATANTISQIGRAHV